MHNPDPVDIVAIGVGFLAEVVAVVLAFALVAVWVALKAHGG